MLLFWVKHVICSGVNSKKYVVGNTCVDEQIAGIDLKQELLGQ